MLLVTLEICQLVDVRKLARNKNWSEDVGHQNFNNHREDVGRQSLDCLEGILLQCK